MQIVTAKHCQGDDVGRVYKVFVLFLGTHGLIVSTGEIVKLIISIILNWKEIWSSLFWNVLKSVGNFKQWILHKVPEPISHWDIYRDPIIFCREMISKGDINI